MWPVSCASTRPKAFAYSLARMSVYALIAPRAGVIAFAPCVVPPWSRRKECTSLEEICVQWEAPKTSTLFGEDLSDVTHS
jgi:hypothetical protein